MIEKYTILKNKHLGENAIIVGAGTSLLGIYNDSRFNKIFNNVVISVNSSILVMPWGIPHPNSDIKSEIGIHDKRYWISNDSLCRRWDWWTYVKKCNATKIVRDSWEKYFNEIPNFLQFSPRKTPEDIINPEDDGLAYCSSMPSGLDLAIQMGCSKIYLLGLDQYFCQGKTHFWQFWPKNKQPKRIDNNMASKEQQMWTFGYNNKAYPALKKFADINGVKVFNCNPDSKVDVFQFLTKDSFFERINIANST